MKHTPKVTLILIILFFVAQIVGLFTVNQYIEVEEDENGKFIGTGKKKLRGKMIKREGVFSGTHYHSLEWYKKARELQFKISGKCDLPEVSE